MLPIHLTEPAGSVADKFNNDIDDVYGAISAFGDTLLISCTSSPNMVLSDTRPFTLRQIHQTYDTPPCHELLRAMNQCATPLKLIKLKSKLRVEFPTVSRL
uniref:Uncharacterized protein n=1 Tax=Megaselia scalaris TaxID=36166 RepID=T1GD10_MEGSC